MKKLTILCLILLSALQAISQSLKFETKIKPGTAIATFPNNEYTAITSGKDIAIVNNTSGLVSRSLTGHEAIINDLVINSEGTQLASVSKDKKAIVWDVESSRKESVLRGHIKAINNVQFIGEDHLATSSDDGTLKIWSLESGQELYSFSDHKKGISSIAARSSMVASGDKDGVIMIRNLNGDLVKQFSIGNSVQALAFDLQEKRLFTADSEGIIRIWDADSWEQTGEFNNGKGRINNLSMAGDDDHFAVSGSSCIIYSSEKQELVYEIDKVSSPVADAGFTPDGNNLFFLEEYVSKAQCWDISPLGIAVVVNLVDEDDKTPPQIFVSSPSKIIEGRVTYYESLIPIKGSIIDDFGVRSLKVNGIETPIQQNGNFVINVPLSMGENFMTIEAMDVNENTALKKFVVNRRNMDGEEYDPSVAKNYLLVVGINSYEHWPRLFNAVKDANDVANTLAGMYNFNVSDIQVITDEQATRSNLYDKLLEYVDKVGPQDNFMIYYSGHGHFDGRLNEGYWVPVDAKINNTGDYLSNSDISKIISNINSQHTFLVADACFSGSLFNEQQRGYAENVERYRSRWALASGRLETVSDGEAGKNSPFTRNFVDYLRSSDKEKVTVSEIVQFVKVQVAEVSDQTPIGNPLKGVGDEGGEFIFYRKKN